jgi:predicted ABC-type ATPase
VRVLPFSEGAKNLMAKQRPKVVVLAGPNGAGKSTSAPRLLRGALKVDEFVNADVIAQGLSAFAPLVTS